MSWCFPEGEEKFKAYKVGDRIESAVLSIDFRNKLVMLSQKHLTQPLSDGIKWERIDRGDEFLGEIIESLNDNYLIKTTKGFYGLLHKSLAPPSSESLKVKVNSKLDYSDLLSFVPAQLEIDETPVIEDTADLKFSFIEEDLRSFYRFKSSLLAVRASDEVCEIVQTGFHADERIFSKEISTNYILYIQFELNSSMYESVFKQQAISYFYGAAAYSEALEKELLELLSTRENYWFRINKRSNRDKEEILEFSLYNESVNFFGIVQISKDKKEHRFLIKSFSFGQ